MPIVCTNLSSCSDGYCQAYMHASKHMHSVTHACTCRAHSMNCFVRLQVNKNKLLVEELSQLLPQSRNQLTPGKIRVSVVVEEGLLRIRFDAADLQACLLCWAK